MNTRALTFRGLVVGMFALVSTTASGEVRRPVDVPQRLRGADQAVVGRVIGIEPTWRRFASGDELIVSRVRLAVEESLKGAGVPVVTVEVEGGQIGDLVLTVSDLPVMRLGERAVVLLERDASGRNVPHLRGQGIMRLERGNRVAGSDLTLDEIRNMAREIGRR